LDPAPFGQTRKFTHIGAQCCDHVHDDLSLIVPDALYVSGRGVGHSNASSVIGARLIWHQPAPDQPRTDPTTLKHYQYHFRVQSAMPNQRSGLRLSAILGVHWPAQMA
jgi:hypothetical protein